MEPEAPELILKVASSSVLSSIDDIVKPSQDKRLYRRITLANGLQAVLIHDPAIPTSAEEESDEEDESSEDGSDWETENDDGDDMHTDEDHSAGEADSDAGSDDDEIEGASSKSQQASATKKAGAAMVVGVGSFSDPYEAQGLAHFLEHMLFMGSTKFPDENEYDAFLQKHGGGSNAFTEVEYTCFHFDVNHKFLHPALDRFAQFFISPLAKVDAMEREVQAVDSEFQQALQSDTCRLQQLQCTTAPHGHPFNKFFWGNKNSLSDPAASGMDMRAALMDLYKEHYRAERMNLVVLGAESLDELQSWVVELFSPIRGGGGPPLSFAGAAEAHPLADAGKVYLVEAVREMQLVNLRWRLPCLHEHYTKKPYDYVSHLVGHEGVGSILSLLKAKGWATGLSAGVGDDNTDRSTAGYIFEVQVTLTLLGLEKWKEVVGIIYEYLAMLRREGPQEWVFQELKATSEMEFNFEEEEEVEDYIVGLAGNMLLYPGGHVIVGDYLLEEWDPALVSMVLDSLNPQNMRTDVLYKSFDAEAPGVKVEPWFNARYREEPISSDLLQSWAAPPQIDPALHMPPPNNFIPTDFSLKYETVASENGVPAMAPKLIYEDKKMKLWYKLDRAFKTPRTSAYFALTTDVAYESPKAAVLTELFIKLLQDALNETIYLANVAKLDSTVYVMGYRLEIKVHGFSHKLGNLIDSIFSQIRDVQVIDNRFKDMQEVLTRVYTNANLRPLKQSAYLRILLTKVPVCPVEEKLAAVQAATPDDLRAFMPRLFRKTFVDAFVAGNVLETEAVSLLDSVRKALGPDTLAQEEQPVSKLVQLQAGCSYLHCSQVKNPAEENSVVEYYCQVGPPKPGHFAQASAIADLAEQLMSEPFYDQLRTKEQLGYRVDCGVRLTEGVFGFCFRVQSADYGPEHLQMRIEAFVKSFREQMASMKAEEFSQHREALAAEKLEKDYNLLQETNRLWLQIWEQRYLFDIRQEEAAEIRNVEQAEMLRWYDKFLLPTSAERRNLTVHIYGKGRERKKGGRTEGTEEVEDTESLKRTCTYYPVTQYA